MGNEISIRRKLLRLAERISRKTSFLDGLKTRLGITRFVLKILAPPVKVSEAAEIAKSFNTGLVSKKVEDCRKRGAVPDFWVLLVMSLGDIMACEPIPRRLKALAPGAKVHWIVLGQFAEALEGNPYVDEVVKVASLTEGKEIASAKASGDGNAIVVDCHFDGTSCPATNRIFQNPANPAVNVHNYYAFGPLLGTFSLAAGLPISDDAPLFHLGAEFPQELEQAFKAPCVVFHCHSSEKCRDLPDAKWNEMAARLTDAGVNVVEVGSVRALAGRNGVFDFTGRRSLRKIAGAIDAAKVFVGIDSAFAHMANAMRKQSVVILGKFRNFESYFPYSGEFSRSRSFSVVRAPCGKPASCASVGEVVEAVLGKIAPAGR